MCKCEQEKWEKEEAERARQENEKRIEKLRKMGFPDAEMQRYTFDICDNQNAKVTNIAKRYVANFEEIKKGDLGYFCLAVLVVVKRL